MGYNDEGAQRIILDIETAPLDDAADYLEEPTAPSNYSKPEAIASYVAKAKAEALAKCALDPDLCRIVAIGFSKEPGIPGEPTEVMTAKSEDDEAQMLSLFWALACGRPLVDARPYGPPMSIGTHFIGYNILGFDVPVLLRRSLYLNVPAPAIQLDKYRHPQITDLLLLLSNNGAAKMRGLAFYQKRMGLPALVGSGADIPALVASGDWEGVSAHLRGDLACTAALARRMGVWP